MSSIKKDRSDYWAGRAGGYGPPAPAPGAAPKRENWFVRLRNRYPSIIYLFTPRVWNDPDHFLPTDVEQEIYFRRRRLKFVAIALLLILGAIFLPERIRIGLEILRARSRAGEALALLAKGDAAGAWDKSDAARVARPREPVVARAVALSAAAMGRWEEAVEAWRLYATVGGAFAPSDLLKRAEALASTGRFGAARNILKEIPAGAADRVAETLLQARISIGSGDAEGAGLALAPLVGDAKLPSAVRLEVIRLLLESQPADSALYRQADEALARMVREPGPEVAAAVEFAGRRAVQKLLPAELLSSAEISRRLRSLPPALERQLLEFDLEIQAQPARLADCVQDAQVVYNRQPTREALVALATWLLKHREWQRVLTLLTPAKAKESPSLALARLTALINNGQLRDAKLEITSQRYLLEPLTQQILLAHIVGAAGDKPASESRWNTAINLAGDDRLRLRQVEAGALAAGNDVVAKRAASLAAAAEAALQLASP